MLPRITRRLCQAAVHAGRARGPRRQPGSDRSPRFDFGSGSLCPACRPCRREHVRRKRQGAHHNRYRAAPSAGRPAPFMGSAWRRHRWGLTSPGPRLRKQRLLPGLRCFRDQRAAVAVGRSDEARRHVVAEERDCRRVTASPKAMFGRSMPCCGNDCAGPGATRPPFGTVGSKISRWPFPSSRALKFAGVYVPIMWIGATGVPPLETNSVPLPPAEAVKLI